jgi:hypothetical protein
VSADAGWWGPVGKTASGFSYTAQNQDNAGNPVVVHAQPFIAVTDVTIDSIRVALLNSAFTGVCKKTNAKRIMAIGLLGSLADIVFSVANSVPKSSMFVCMSWPNVKSSASATGSMPLGWLAWHCNILRPMGQGKAAFLAIRWLGWRKQYINSM